MLKNSEVSEPLWFSYVWNKPKSITEKSTGVAYVYKKQPLNPSAASLYYLQTGVVLDCLFYVHWF